jgi:hypothetical protein
MAKLGEYGCGEHRRTDGWPSVLGHAEQYATWRCRNADAACDGRYPQLLSMLVRHERVTLLTKYTGVKDVSCGNKSTMANYSGLKRTINIDFAVLIV